MLRLGRSLVKSKLPFTPNCQFSASSYLLSPTIGIRREDKNRWERRVPLSPDHVQQLVDQGVDVIVQPSSLRVFDDEAYIEAGAKLKEDLSEADCIICVKEVPEELLFANKTYLFFSHTIKAQRNNMAMLDAILSKNIRLIDYERIIDPNSGQRLVRFGKYAGIAGMIDLFRALGNRLLFLKYSTPFLHLGYTHMYVNLEAAKQAVTAIGEEILLKGIPRDLSPMVFIFTGGEGNCSLGAREIFELLPHKYVKPEDLPALVKSKDPGHRFRVYGCCVGSKDYMVPKDPHSTYSRSDYYNFPEKYECNFATKIAPYSSVIVNNTYWDGRIPRLLTRKQLRDIWKKRGKGRLLAVADISCDINGSIEAMTKTTNIDEPVFVYDPLTGRTSDSIDYSGILFLAVDNLPTELPKEASCHFGEMLVPFLPAIAKSSEAKTYEELKGILPAEVAPAVITCNGELTKPYEYIAQLRKQDESKIKRVLVLGSGYVTAGLINVLSQDSDTHITIASQFLEEAEKFASIANIKAVELNVLDNLPRTIELIQTHDVVVSILPQFFHTRIAELCIKYKRNMLTASYIKPEMRELDEKAKEAGIIILNEIGLDPGIDHMSAVKMISEIKSKGGKVKTFRSICGGLPAPEFADNPFYYKFSWSPRGVLEAGKNSATYLKEGEIINIKGGDLFLNAENSEIHPCFSMEVLPNRDSTSYVESYGLEDASTVFRGTLRYKGYSYVMWGIKELGLLSADSYPGLDPKHPLFSSWPDFLASFLSVDKSRLREAVVEKLLSSGNVPDRFAAETGRIVKALEWLGVFDESTEFSTNSTPIDTLCSLLTARLQFERHERDMILLQHELGVEWADGKCEKLRSTLITFGEAAGETAMAKTVGYPLGIAAELILSNKIKSRGVIGPVLPEIYEPLLKELKNRGLSFVETVV